MNKGEATQRDNFRAPTKRLLAERVGYLCSNPNCRRPTLGPHPSKPGKSIRTGEAAHISAAAKGKRYDPKLTSEQRIHESNGIWLCGICHPIVDSDEDVYTIEGLRTWKKAAESGAFVDLVRRSTEKVRTPEIVFDENDKVILAKLGLRDPDTIDETLIRVTDAASADLQAFLREKDDSQHLVDLNLLVSLDGGQVSANLDDIVTALSSATSLCLIAQPGTGKSTTLLQLALRLIQANSGLAPIYLPLDEWSTRPETFFEAVARRYSYKQCSINDLRELSYFGKSVIFLDGWNELDPTSRNRALKDIQALKRDFPLVRFVVASRPHHGLPPHDLRVSVELLNYSQQMKISKVLRGNDGLELLERARQQDGVRDLVKVPLYLNVLMQIQNLKVLPQTKEEILRLFVNQHEAAPERAERLRNELFGTHRQILSNLASTAIRQANTVLTDVQARQSIARTEEMLVQDGLITIKVQPASVLDTLSSTHTLTLRSVNPDTFAFEHEQFQEWYASFEVESLMRLSHGGSEPVHQELRCDILNWPSWEEAVLFACDRLSRSDDAGKAATAAAIEDALQIDPMLAAEMIYRVSDECWRLVADRVLAFARAWHISGKLDRGFRFMLLTGRPEFADDVWPLLAHDDDQIHLRALRAVDRFRLGVLGPDAETRIDALDEQVRAHVLGEIAHHGETGAIDLVVAIAKRDPSPSVVEAVVSALSFQRADGYVADLLSTESDEVWQSVAYRIEPDELPDEALRARLIAARERQTTEDRNPVRKLSRLVQEPEIMTEARNSLKALIASEDFPVGDATAQDVIRRAFELCPDGVAEAILRRLEAGHELPYRAERYLAEVATTDEGPVVERALDRSDGSRGYKPAAVVLGAETIGKLIDRIFEIDDAVRAAGSRSNKDLSEEQQYLKDVIRAARPTSFATAWLKRAEYGDPSRIATLSDLLARYGREDDDQWVRFNEVDTGRFVDAIRSMVAAALRDESCDRRDFAELARSIKRIGDPELYDELRSLLERDLADWKKANQRFIETRRHEDRPDFMNYGNLYRAAFTAIGGTASKDLMVKYLPDHRFGVDAAIALAIQWRNEHPVEEPSNRLGGYDFSHSGDLQLRRNDPAASLDSSKIACVILDCASDLAESKSVEDQNHAIRLARVACGLPYGRARETLEKILGTTPPLDTKIDLLIAMALAGEQLDSVVLLAGIAEQVAIAQKESWRVNGENSSWYWTRWLMLFAFSDGPMAVINAIDQIPFENIQRELKEWGLRPILEAYQWSPHPDAWNALEELARRNKTLLGEFAWLHAIPRLGSEYVGKAIIDLICDDEFFDHQRNVEARYLAEALSELAERFPDVRTTLIDRYRSMSPSRQRAIFEDALSHIADDEILLIMIERYAVEKRSFDHRLADALKNVAVEQVPAPGWVNAYTERCKPLAEMRATLFALAAKDCPEGAIAERCLLAIEEYRDELGLHDNEPRHPDISNEAPWPKLPVSGSQSE